MYTKRYVVIRIFPSNTSGEQRERLFDEVFEFQIKAGHDMIASGNVSIDCSVSLVLPWR